MTKKIIAVSGGVDSVVLLHMMSLHYAPNELVVAHFEHGIRGDESAADARFVEALAAMYGIACEIGYGNLSEAASEATARTARYEFLFSVVKQYEGKLLTAHHQDDLIETIALNLWRGTGWRGLAVFGNQSIERPLLSMKKQALYAYALEHNLEWVEDATNQSLQYTRNQLRKRLSTLSDEARQQLTTLYDTQVARRQEIKQRSVTFRERSSSRYFMTMIPESVALELLRAASYGQLTRPQLRRLLLAVKTAKPATSVEVGNGITAQFTTREFSLKTPRAPRGKGDII